jgi:hypothetical protein
MWSNLGRCNRYKEWISDGPLYNAESPLDPFVHLGDWKNTPGIDRGWSSAFDVEFLLTTTIPTDGID